MGQDHYQSLAEFLDVDGATPAETTQESVPRLEDISDPQKFAKAVLASREFRSYIVNGLVLGNLSGFTGILIRLMDYAWGKPVERLEVKDTTLDELTPELVKDKLQRVQRMLQLLEPSEAEDVNRIKVH